MRTTEYTVDWEIVRRNGSSQDTICFFMDCSISRYYASGEALAKEMGIAPGVLQDTMNTYNATWEKCRDNAPGAQYDAYGGGKTHDPFGKKYFHNMPVAMDDEYHVAIVTPTIHYCMGGLEIDANSLVLNQSGKPIKGLYAAGEIAGGVHGNNRLGGDLRLILTLSQNIILC